MKRKSSTLALALVFFVGLCVLLYPLLSDYYNSFHQSRAIATYQADLSNLTKADYRDLKEAAGRYNAALAARGELIYENGEPVDETYRQLLNVMGDGMMGYLTIRTLGVQLPVYHGTSEGVLAVAVGHLEGSSLPVGGLGTHCVLSGHRGLPSATLFTELDKLEIGDTFTFSVLDETLTYEVDNIAVVEPEDVSLMQIDPEKDYCTLFTCTPYGVNSHRLLVRGVRIENEKAGTRPVRVTADAVRIDPLSVAAALSGSVLAILLIALLIGRIARGQGKRR